MSCKGYTSDETIKWDWTLNNSELARQYGITRERVRQIRGELGFPPPPIRGTKERRVIQQAKQLEKESNEISVDKIRSLIKGENVSVPYVREVLDKHGIEFLHGNQKYPWSKVNWNLPNITISDVWGIPYSDVVEARNNREEGDALWERTSTDPKFLEAVKQEQLKINEI